VCKLFLNVSVWRSVKSVFNRAIALEQLQELAFAPLVQMQDLPRESLSHHLGFRKEDHNERDGIDKSTIEMAKWRNPSSCILRLLRCQWQWTLGKSTSHRDTQKTNEPYHW
jgi:hypothetical protein